MDPRGSCTIDPDDFGMVLDIKQPRELFVFNVHMVWRIRGSGGSRMRALPRCFSRELERGEGFSVTIRSTSLHR